MNPEQRSKILEKIQKLMALSVGTDFKDEAKAAKEAAIRLMTDYEIFDSELEKAKGKSSIIEEEIKQTGLFSVIGWVSLLYLVIGDQHGVTHFRRRGVKWGGKLYVSAVIVLIGRKADIEDVKYFYDVLSKQIQDLTDEWYKKMKEMNQPVSATSKHDFRFGMISGLRNLYFELNKGVEKEVHERGLVLVNNAIARKDEAEKWLEKHHDNIKNANNNQRDPDVGAYASGFASAKNLKLTRGIEKENKNSCLSIEG